MAHVFLYLQKAAKRNAGDCSAQEAGWLPRCGAKIKKTG